MGEGGNEKPADELLAEHAARCWETETKNADELAFRENLILSAIAVLLGIGLYQIEWYKNSESRVIQSDVALWFIKGFLLAGMAFFLTTFLGLFGKGILLYSRRWVRGTAGVPVKFARRYLFLWGDMFSEAEQRTRDHEQTPDALGQKGRSS